MITPLLTSLKESGGTLYTFSSASRDLSKYVFANADYKLVFSHFACLNIPDIYSGIPDNAKYMNLEAFEEAKKLIDGGDSRYDYSRDGMNNMLATHFQNYLMNYEVAILDGIGNDTDYDSSEPHTVSERIFFDWLQKIGCIQFTNILSSENIISNGLDTSKFAKEIFRSSKDNNGICDRVVNYLGDIDVVNQVDLKGDTYTELYLHVPSEVGATPNVIFKKNDFDANWVDGDTQVYWDNGENGNYNENIIGRKDGGDLALDAFYDVESNNAYTKYTTVDGSDSDSDEDNWSGMGIDFDANDYYAITDSTKDEIDTIMQYNGADEATNFEFNTVLIYYDLVNRSTGKKTTNLYGVLFLNGITDVATNENSADNQSGAVVQGYIQRYPKYKQSTLNGVNGNAWGLKVNLKIDTVPESNGVDTIINEYNTYSMSLFSDAMAKLQDTNDIFYKQQNEIADLQERLDDVENLVGSVSSFSQLQSEIDDLRKYVENAAVGLEKESTLLDMIAKVNYELTQLMNGNTPATLQFNTDVINGGNGINIVKDDINKKITIEENHSTYYLNTIINKTKINAIDGEDNSEITKDNPISLHYNAKSVIPTVEVALGEYTNLCNIYCEKSTATAPFYIHINDDSVTWKRGQLFRLILHNWQIGNQTMYISASNELYKKDWMTFSAHDISGYNPIIDIVCLDDVVTGPESFSFVIVKGDASATTGELITAEEDTTHDRTMVSINNVFIDSKNKYGNIDFTTLINDLADRLKIDLNDYIIGGSRKVCVCTKTRK